MSGGSKVSTIACDAKVTHGIHRTLSQVLLKPAYQCLTDIGVYLISLKEGK